MFSIKAATDDLDCEWVSTGATTEVATGGDLKHRIWSDDLKHQRWKNEPVEDFEPVQDIISTSETWIIVFSTHLFEFVWKLLLSHGPKAHQDLLIGSGPISPASVCNQI
ncbi:hypothetical protein L1987_79849 [Smallanthus sonchifolius]|uniref:Uncharacterized protein n=1 Tax=Smallanthus sonchifolius TaxID=185202 RepID=A0ACB8YLP7_9ASTR|nr:hypothetical protein L1987_79849 [Smallanthus sonchifolius]